jgi:hypothetical protein
MATAEAARVVQDKAATAQATTMSRERRVLGLDAWEETK